MKRKKCTIYQSTLNLNERSKGDFCFPSIIKATQLSVKLEILFNCSSWSVKIYQYMGQDRTGLEKKLPETLSLTY